MPSFNVFHVKQRLILALGCCILQMVALIFKYTAAVMGVFYDMAGGQMHLGVSKHICLSMCWQTHMHL